MSPSRVSYSSHKSALSDDFSVLTPACDFIVEHLFAQSYAIIFTIYSVSCAEADKRYWDRVVFLNAHTDVKLLTHLEVNRKRFGTPFHPEMRVQCLFSCKMEGAAMPYVLKECLPASNRGDA
uniref:[Histone H3]-lysine(79) N-trimethyltransferase n=1 Tax=Ascaris lumbricoides TaxID=6252 RepID=A0A0M3I0A4_ASCLU